jgi:CubicO group peptidase (beta-lactamase class C family)
MESTTFELPQHPDLLKRLCAFPARLPSGQLAPDTSGIFPVINPKDDSGGSGAYSCATDYIKLLDSLLHDDGRLLKPETVAELFRPQLHDTTHLEHALAGPLAQYLIPGMPPGTKWNHALGGIVAVDGIEGRAGKGTMMWWGLPNSYWVS